MDLKTHIESPGTIADVAAYLGNLTPQQRASEVLSLSKRHQRTLYLKAECSPDATVEDFVPADLPTEKGLCHHGHNSLPLFRDFEKYFARSGDQIVGFNEGSSRKLIGPGYFVCRPTTGKESLRAAWVVDYFDVPQGPVPADWPEVVPNWRGLQFFVFRNTRDYMRKICDGVLIGSAYKTILGREFKLDSYFVLVRGAL